MNYYERHLGDYARDTGHLSPVEHGVYNLMLDRYYATEEPIPADQAYRICRARSKEEREAVDAVLREFFCLDGANYRHSRVEDEIEKARARIENSRSNGKRGGRPRKNPMGSDSETRNEPSGFAPGSSDETQTKAHQTPDTRHQSPEGQEHPSPSAQSSSTATPTTDLLGENGGPADLAAKRAQRLAVVTADAIAAYNQILGKPHGLLRSVRVAVGADTRRDQVKRCLKTASEICQELYADSRITPDFWRAYFETAAGDEFHSGRGPYSGDHANWLPDFEFLTRRNTMLKLFERAVGDEDAEAAA